MNQPAELKRIHCQSSVHRDFTFPSVHNYIRFIESLHYGPGTRGPDSKLLAGFTSNYHVIASNTGGDMIFQNFNAVELNEFAYNCKREVLYIKPVQNEEPRAAGSENPTLFVLTSETRPNPDGSEKVVPVLQAICVGKRTLKPLFQFPEQCFEKGTKQIDIRETGLHQGEFEMLVLVDKKRVLYSKHICKLQWFKELSQNHTTVKLESQEFHQKLALSFDMVRSKYPIFAVLSLSETEYHVQTYAIGPETKRISPGWYFKNPLLDLESLRLGLAGRFSQLWFDSKIGFYAFAGLFHSVYKQGQEWYFKLLFLNAENGFSPPNEEAGSKELAADQLSKNEPGPPMFLYRVNPTTLTSKTSPELQTATAEFSFGSRRHGLVVFGVVGTNFVGCSVVSRPRSGEPLRVKGFLLDWGQELKSRRSSPPASDCLMALGSSVKIDTSKSNKVTASITVSYGRCSTFELGIDLTQILKTGQPRQPE